MVRGLLCTPAIAQRPEWPTARRGGGWVAAGDVKQEGSNVSDRVRDFLGLLAAWRWDHIVRRRAVPGRWFIFHDAPDQVVSRWAATEPGEVASDPLLDLAVLQAQGELELRRLHGKCGRSVPMADETNPLPDGGALDGPASPAQPVPPACA